MPIYTWRVVVVVDEPSSGRIINEPDTEVQVIRSVDSIGVPPTEEEFPGAADLKWERVICSAAKFKRGPNWRGMKGSW